MNAKRLIASTNSKDLILLSHHGTQIASMYEQIRLVLGNTLSPDHAAIMSEPLIEPDQRQIDWYTNLQGEIVPLGQAPADQRDEAIKLLSSYAAEIDALGQRYRESKDSQQRRIGNMLELALKYPGEPAIYLVDAKPVIVGWGTTTTGQAGEPERLTRLAPTRPVTNVKGRMAKANGAQRVPTTLQNITLGKRRWGWPLWLIPGFIVGLLFLAFMLGGAYYYLPGCTGPRDDSILREGQDRQAVLLERRSSLRDEYTKLRRDCPGCNDNVPVENIEQRRKQAGGNIGRLVISLAWNGKDDLDLHVIEPNGNRIFFTDSHRISPSGGHYDVDANRSSTMDHPIENIVWENAPPAGVYTVGVMLYSDREPRGSPTAYTVEIIDNGNVRRYNGKISANQGSRWKNYPYNEDVKFEYNPNR